MGLIEPHLAACSKLRIVTLTEHNTVLASAVLAKLMTIKPSLILELKLTKVFHDSFWIADGQRGIFVGTSLNGLGKRYALLDFLQDEDAKDIFARIESIP